MSLYKEVLGASLTTNNTVMAPSKCDTCGNKNVIWN